MEKSYALAYQEIISQLRYGGDCLDCGAYDGSSFDYLQRSANLPHDNYYGVEWNQDRVASSREKGLNIIHSDLNCKLPFEDDKFSCVFGLSVLEHLLNPCHFLSECYRVMKKDAALILLTPNISTYFTAALVLMGKMPSSGPHPDSNLLISHQEIYKVSSDKKKMDSEASASVHRHLVVFSYRVLSKYLNMIGFHHVSGHGFGVYPFPNFMQPILERIDRIHCHQMVFIAKK